MTTTLVDTDTAAELVGRTPHALGWDASRRRVTTPTLVDGEAVWDIEVLRADLAAYRRRARQAHPRWSRSTNDYLREVGRARRADRARDQVPRSTWLGDDCLSFHNAHGPLGQVVRGDHAKGFLVWRIVPASRVAHAHIDDLPWARTRDEAVDRLLSGRFTL